MSKIGLIDGAKGAIRLVLTLYKSKELLNTTQLQDRMDELYGVKKGATGTAIHICSSLGLIEIKQGDKKPMPPSYHSLTEKGKKAAELLVRLEEMLEES